MNTNDAAKMFATILCVPGMNEVVKIDLKISRKNVLLLSTVIERGLTAKDDDKSNLFDSFPKDSLQELTAFSTDCLQKAGLTDLNAQLKTLGSK